MKQPMNNFICPKCGGSHFGRDTSSIGGRVVVLDTVRCHTPKCGWRGEWIEPTTTGHIHIRPGRGLP